MEEIKERYVNKYKQKLMELLRIQEEDISQRKSQPSESYKSEDSFSQRTEKEMKVCLKISNNKNRLSHEDMPTEPENTKNTLEESENACNSDTRYPEIETTRIEEPKISEARKKTIRKTSVKEYAFQGDFEPQEVIKKAPRELERQEGPPPLSSSGPAFQNPEGRKIARRNTKPLSRKRKCSNEHESMVKRMKTEKTESFLEEYRKEYNKEMGREKNNEIEMLKKRLAELEAERNKEKVEAERVKEELLNIKAENAKELQEKHNQEIERIRKEGEMAAMRIKEEMMKIVALKEEMIKESAKQHPLYIPRSERHQTMKIKPPEPVSLRECGVKKPNNLCKFFQEAKKEHIEKINRTIMLKNEERAKKKEAASESKGDPSGKMEPHKLYKQSIDALSNSLSPNNYVPKCKIPFYASENEFNLEEKKFDPAEFTKDPNLIQIVRMQDHDKLERCFGSVKEIDVERIFSGIDNVSNNSPNKFVKH